MARDWSVLCLTAQRSFRMSFVPKVVLSTIRQTETLPSSDFDHSDNAFGVDYYSCISKCDLLFQSLDLSAVRGNNMGISTSANGRKVSPTSFAGPPDFSACRPSCWPLLDGKLYTDSRFRDEGNPHSRINRTPRFAGNWGICFQHWSHFVCSFSFPFYPVWHFYMPHSIIQTNLLITV